MLVFGKAIGGGVPVGTYGMTEAVADRVRAAVTVEDSDVGGIGGTLAGNPLSLAAVRATLGEVLTEEAFARMIPLAARWEAGVNEVIAANDAPWHVTRLGCRAEYHFLPAPPRTGAEQWAAGDTELERYLHLHALNRGILLTPFHNMALMCPATTEADVDRHTEAFAEAAASLFGVARVSAQEARQDPSPLARPAAARPERATATRRRRRSAPASRRRPSHAPRWGRRTRGCRRIRATPMTSPMAPSHAGMTVVASIDAETSIVQAPVNRYPRCSPMADPEQSMEAWRRRPRWSLASHRRPAPPPRPRSAGPAPGRRTASGRAR